MGRRNSDNEHCRFVQKTREIYNILEDGLEIIQDSDFRKQKTLGETLGYERIRTTRITRKEKRRDKRERKKYSSKSRMNNNQHPLSDKRFKKKNGGKRANEIKAKNSSKAVQNDTRENQ